MHQGQQGGPIEPGEWRNHVGTQTRASVCVVRALAAYQRHSPDRFQGSLANDLLFAWPDRRLLTRSDVAYRVSAAAAACGQDPNDIGTHSLRIGGASALWAAYGDSALVQSGAGGRAKPSKATYGTQGEPREASVTTWRSKTSRRSDAWHSEGWRIALLVVGPPMRHYTKNSGGAMRRARGSH